MKKSLLTIVLIAAIYSIASAQTTSSAYAPGSSLFSVGIGIGSPFFGSGYTSSLPVNPTVSYEKGIIAGLSVGAEASYASQKFSYNDGLASDDYSITYSAIYLGVRGSYHFGDLLSLPKNIDLYGGATAGYVILVVSDNEGNAAAGSGAGGGAFVGGKYYFASNIGVYAEAGYQSLSYLNVGVTFKF